MILNPTKRKTEAVIAFCPDCRAWLEANPYWSFRKSIGLHESGTGHKPILYVIADQPAARGSLTWLGVIMA